MPVACCVLRIEAVGSTSLSFQRQREPVADGQQAEVDPLVVVQLPVQDAEGPVSA